MGICLKMTIPEWNRFSASSSMPCEKQKRRADGEEEGRMK